MLAVYKERAYPALYLLSCLLNLGSPISFPNNTLIKESSGQTHSVRWSKAYVSLWILKNKNTSKHGPALWPRSYSTPPLSHISLQLSSTEHKEEEAYSVQQLGSIKSTSSMFLRFQAFQCFQLWIVRVGEGINSLCISQSTCLKSTEILLHFS